LHLFWLLGNPRLQPWASLNPQQERASAPGVCSLLESARISNRIDPASKVHMTIQPQKSLYALFLATLILCMSCNHSPKQPTLSKPVRAFGGEEWLSWTVAERNQYVYGYLVGYEFSFSEACRAAEDHDLLREHMSPSRGEENSINVAATRCLSYRKNYSKERYTIDKGANVSPYSEIITEMYEKHPDSRSAMYELLMELLSDGQATTAEELYKAQLNQWPNARIE
jgi:hypothetical protein